MNMDLSTVRIKDLKLRTYIGIFDWEQKEKQDVIINLTIDFDASRAAQSDQIEDTVDYKKICKGIIGLVEEGRFMLIEKMANDILRQVMQDQRIQKTHIEIDKPGALRFARSVSFATTHTR